MTAYRLQNLSQTARIVVAALAIGIVFARTAAADSAIKILIPSDDSCSTYLDAVNSGDRGAILNLGGWALGYWSALAEQAGKDILRNTTGQLLLDKLATDCQAQPNTPMSAITAAIGRALLAGQTP